MTQDARGYWILEPGDESNTGWMPALNANTQRFSSHSHNGVDSVTISFGAAAKTTQTLAAASWAGSGSGYKQTVTMPVGLTYLNSFMRFFVSKGGDAYDNSEFFPTTVYVSANSFDIYCSDSTVAVKIIYL